MALTGTPPPGAVGGEPVEQVIEADLRAETRSQPGKAVLAAASTRTTVFWTAGAEIGKPSPGSPK
jgi:hypothetical protein